MPRFFAHSMPGRPDDEWEPLEDHLQAVADLAAEFADKFDAAEWGRVVGLWHDLGKYSNSFQAYLRAATGMDAHLEGCPGRVDHSTAGAQHAVAAPLWGRLLAYIIAGHHAGLADATGGAASLAHRLAKNIKPFDSAPPGLLTVPPLARPGLAIDTANKSRASFQLSLFTRMLFSCLVDADFLATESFMNPNQAEERPRTGNVTEVMRLALDENLAMLANNATNNEIGRRRQEVLAACRAAAEQAQGLFTLTVPTGGGKTLASLAFALAHAQRHELERVVYAIPFTSIIDQTADVFRKVFSRLGDDVVLEHHSNVDPDDPKRETRQSRLASENWDAPLIVSTNVQLFESLFAARTSRCRKLHNLVRSVIILDEAQTIPVDLLHPCLAALRELVLDYHCTIVLCTATQPALSRRAGFPIGLDKMQEIAPDPNQLYQAMKRVDVQQIGPLTDEQIVDRLGDEKSYLCIVNTRPHAARLFTQLRDRVKDDEDLFHLSTNLCGQHRATLIEKIRQRLSCGEPCRVISTQLIEAGVDVDFPVVYRALSGLDSIAQAAGRCNREGKRDKATVYVFEATDVHLQGYLESVRASAAEVILDFGDLLDPVSIRHYFELHYWKHADHWDKHDVLGCFPTPVQDFAFDFRTASERFKMIEDAGKAVFVPYDRKAEQLVEKLRKEGPSRWLLRRLQRYTVSIYENTYMQMLGKDIEELPGEYAVLLNRDCYDKRLGLRVDRMGYHEPETMIC